MHNHIAVDIITQYSVGNTNTFDDVWCVVQMLEMESFLVDTMIRRTKCVWEWIELDRNGWRRSCLWLRLDVWLKWFIFKFNVSAPASCRLCFSKSFKRNVYFGLVLLKAGDEWWFWGRIESVDSWMREILTNWCSIRMPAVAMDKFRQSFLYSDFGFCEANLNEKLCIWDICCHITVSCAVIQLTIGIYVIHSAAYDFSPEMLLSPDLQDLWSSKQETDVDHQFVPWSQIQGWQRTIFWSWPTGMRTVNW